MIMRIALIGTTLMGGAAAAADRALSTTEIADLLPRIIATGEGTRQTFSGAGATTYSQGGRDSYGSWWAEGGRYCSRWPPSDGFACYDVMLNEAPADGGDPILTWTGDSGMPSVNRVKLK